MMRCKECGSEITTRICWNCGADNMSEPDRVNNVEYTDILPEQNDGMFGNHTISKKNGTSATITAGTWFKMFGIGWLISLIPIVGPIAMIIYYIVLLCKETTAPSIRGYIKLKLIFSLIIIIILAIIMLFWLFVLGKSIALY